MGWFKNFMMGNAEKALKKNNILLLIRVLNPKRPDSEVRQRLIAATALGNITNEDIKSAKPPIENYSDFYSNGSNITIISRLIDTLKDKNQDVIKAAYNALITIINRYNAGEDILYFFDDDFLRIGVALLEIDHEVGYKLLNKALEKKVLIDSPEKRNILSKIDDPIIIIEFIILTLNQSFGNKYEYVDTMKEFEGIIEKKCELGILGCWIMEFCYPYTYNNVSPFENENNLEKTFFEDMNFEKFKEKKKELILNDNYDYLTGFVDKCPSLPYITYHPKRLSISRDCSAERYTDFKLLDNLKKLFRLNGQEINYNELLWLISHERWLKRYNKFKDKIIYNKPKDLDGFIKNLLDAYGENYEEYLNLFEYLLKERGLEIDSINERINDAIKMKELDSFKKEITNKTSKFLSLKGVDSLDGYEFENFLKIILEKMGYSVENTKLSGDQGADLIAQKFGEKIVIQAKRYKGKVGNKAVQEVVASIAHYDANRGIVVTNSEFTKSAIELAHSNNIKLIDRAKLYDIMEEYPVKTCEIQQQS